MRNGIPAFRRLIMRVWPQPSPVLINRSICHRTCLFASSSLWTTARQSASPWILRSGRADKQEYLPSDLPFREFEFVDDGKAIRFSVDTAEWTCSLISYDCRSEEHTSE